jgi:hypothetical protein
VPTGRIIKSGLLAAAMLAARVASAQGTTTFLSNIGQASAGSLSVGADSWIAGGFETGTNGSGYLLDSIQLGMAGSTGSPNAFTVMVYANGAPTGLNPGSSLATFVGPLDPSAVGTYTYTFPGGLMLSPRSPYYVVVTAGTAVADGSYEWNYDNTADYNSVNGWEGGVYFQSGNGSAWAQNPNVALQFALIGSAAPEPGVVALLAVGGVAMICSRHRRSSARTV